MSRWVLRRLPGSRAYSSEPRIRNIGIIAHIDAGKTTTTERMLYYSGFTRRIGLVDRGDTVMDFLPDERERGITISSAAITFGWGEHTVNLVDTPGHVDFAFEVERALRVLDGAVCILDAGAGVQAQTRAVWRQTDRYRVPRLVFVNKMDRPGADWARCLREIGSRLGALALPVQWPVAGDGPLRVADLVRGRVLGFGAGGVEAAATAAYAEQRTALCEALASVDDAFLEAYLEDPEPAAAAVAAAVRRATLAGTGVPVLCGAAFQNAGVQPLLDAVVDYLPGPGVGAVADGALSMLAFKCVYDAQRGFLVYVRVYAGTYRARTGLRNRALGQPERPTKVLQVLASSYAEVDELGPGAIGVLVGLRHTRTGDVLDAAVGEPGGAAGPPMQIPPAVFFCSAEPESAADEDRLAGALQCITREDPSVRVLQDRESGQTLLAGIGELHLDIVQRRITRDFRVRADFGAVRIAHRDRCAGPCALRVLFQREANGARLSADLSLAMEPLGTDENEAEGAGGDPLVQTTLAGCLQSSPASGNPFMGTRLRLTVHGPPSCTQAVCQGILHVFRLLTEQHPPVLMEPVMLLSIECPVASVGPVVNDLHARRRAQVRLVQAAAGDAAAQTIEAVAPLSAVLGYASYLRSATQGRASYSVVPQGYQPV